jgi:hypothetical protein
MATLTARVQAPRRRQRHALVRHFLEMVLAMFVGMAVLGAVVSIIFAVLGCSNLLHHVGIRAPIMATNMSIGMAVWMRHRGHRWPAVGEMVGAMYVPLAILLVPFWIGVLPDGAVLGPMHLLMLPAMAIVMLRRRGEYVHAHHSAVAELPIAHMN